jgi:lipoprotein-releasing system permease protein
VNDWAPFEWTAATRFLREGRLQTSFIAAGVSIGVAVIVFMSAMLDGMQANFIRRVLTSQAHIVLLPPQEVARPLYGAPGVAEAPVIQRPYQRIRSIDQWQKIMAELEANASITAVSPMVSGPVLASRGEASRAVTAMGVDPDRYYRIVKIPDLVVAGTPRLNSTDIGIGIELARDLGVTVGDKLRVASAGGGAATLSISGIVDLGSKGANTRSTFVALHTGQSLLNLVGGVSSIDLTVDNIYAAEDIARNIESAFGIQADSWIKTNAQFFSAVSAQTTANTAIRVFVGLSVAFGIASVLFVSVVQKSKEIGILRAMGASRGQIMRVFLLQGGILGLAGSLVGSAAGAGALVVWQSLARNADGTPMFPLILDPRLFVAAAVLATATGLAAALAPALRGARLDPVVAIRG